MNRQRLTNRIYGRAMRLYISRYRALHSLPGGSEMTSQELDKAIEGCEYDADEVNGQIFDGAAELPKVK